MLPAAPKTLGRLSDVFSSAASAVAGLENPLGLARVDSAVVVLVDGLGFANVRDAAGHARWLWPIMQASKPVNTVFPSTTAAALTSFATGRTPAEHGLVGYRVFDRAVGSGQNLLSGWTNWDSATGWREGPTISDALPSGVTAHFVGAGAYARSGFTNVIMPGADYVPAATIADRFRAARELAATPGNLIYLYVPELDQVAHAHGVRSLDWLGKLEALEAELRDFVGKLSGGVGVILTADHGVVDVEQRNHLHLDQLELPAIKYVGGDTRCAYIYLEDSATAENASSAIDEAWGDSVLVADQAALRTAGWIKGDSAAAARRWPDVFVMAKKSVAIYHREFSAPKSYAMVGHHGSISSEELQIPITRFGRWA